MGGICFPATYPAHVHADALSFVLWIDGQPIIVDRGAFAYSGPDRSVFRATAAHSTVEVDGEDQCVFWGDFRASFIPNVERPHVRTFDGIVMVESSHDGYRRLRDPVIHHRAMIWVPDSGAVVVDRLLCRGVHEVTSRLQLAPELDPDGGRVNALQIAPLVGSASTQNVSHSPFFGTRVPAKALVTRLKVADTTAFGWSILRPGTTAHVASEEVIVLRGAERMRIALRRLR